MSKRRKKVDTLLIAIVFGLLLIGFLTLFSISAPLAKKEQEELYTYLKHQALFGLLPGLGLGFFFSRIKIKALKDRSLLLFLASLALTGATFLPFVGVEIGGARRWMGMGSLSFQPSEILKITLPLYLSVWLTRKQKKSLSTLFCFLLVLAPLALVLILQPDLSTLFILCFLALLVYFLSGSPITHLFILAGLAGIAFTLLIHLTPYRFSRLLVFLHPEIDPLGEGYQIRQSLIAIGSGGIWGKGFGFSKQKLGFLPNVISDSIFSAFCEETGLVGSGLLTLMFLAFFFRVIIKARRIEDKFPRVLASVLGSGILFQAFLNMGAMTGLLPLTGSPLPFVSYGGSHLLTELAACGLILNLLD